MVAAVKSPPIHVMVVTPFTDDFAIDAARFRAVVRFAAEGGNAIWVASQGSGEGLVLSQDERRQLYELAVEEVGRKVPVLAAGIGLSGTAQAISDAQMAFSAGAAAVQILPPRPGPVAIGLREDETRAYFDDVLSAVSGPVYLANNVPLAGTSFSIDLMEDLVARHRHIVGINYTDFNFGRFVDLAGRIDRRIELRSGIVAQMAGVRAVGGCGILCYEPNVDPHVAAAAWKHPERPEYFGRLLKLSCALSRPGNPRSLKAALEMQGRGKAVLRKPLLPPTPEETELLRTELDALGLLESKIASTA